MGCNPNIAQSILDAEADYLLAVKDNQPTLHAEIKSYFETAPCGEVERFQTLRKECLRSRQAGYPELSSARREAQPDYSRATKPGHLACSRLCRKT